MRSKYLGKRAGSIICSRGGVTPAHASFLHYFAYLFYYKTWRGVAPQIFQARWEAFYIAFGFADRILRLKASSLEKLSDS